MRGIFEGQVGGWYRVPSSWPVSRDFDLIKRWFEYRFHSMLVDLCEDRWSAMNSDIGMRSKYRYSGPKSYFRTLRELNQLFALNRKMLKAYLLKESLDRLWTYHYEGAMLNYLERWIDQLRWQRLEPFQKLAKMLLEHLDGILNYCRTKVRLGVVEAVNGNIKSLLRRGRGYQNLRYLLLKAQRMAATRTEFVVFRKAA